MSDEIQNRLLSEHLELATIQKRAIAFFVDEMLTSFLFIIIIYDQLQQVSDPEAIVALVQNYTLEYMLIKIIYQTIFVYQYGATLGKMLMKIAVVERDTLDKPRFASALNRSVFRIISESVFYLGFVWAFYTKNRESWHDKTARTLVVNV